VAGVHAAEFAMNVLDTMAGFRAPAPHLPVLVSPAATPDAGAEDVGAPPEEPAAPAPRAEPMAAEVEAVDAGHDAAPDAARPRARRAPDAGLDARPPPPPRLAVCSPELAHQVEAHYAGSTSFRATFDQELIVSAYNSVTRSHGSFVVKKPGKMSWTYDDPESSRILSDGVTVVVYEAPNKHLYRVPAATSPYPGAFAFLTGQVPLTGVFDFTAHEPAAGPPSTCVLVGTPRTLTRTYQKVMFHVDRGTLDVHRVVIHDRAGDQNRIDLSDPAMDVPVDEGQFTFTPPPDTIVVGR